MLLSFGYGVFHAAGPGHGKAVISAWLLATENELRRGMLISFLSAIIQALTAILLVSVLFLVVASVGSTARNVAGVLESASYALIALLGALSGVDGAAPAAPAQPRRRRCQSPPSPASRRASPSRSHDFAGFEPMKSAGCRGRPRARPRLRLRPCPSARRQGPPGRLVLRQGLLARLRGGHQALHRAPSSCWSSPMGWGSTGPASSRPSPWRWAPSSPSR